MDESLARKVRRTAIGRTTIFVPNMNHPDVIRVRRSLIEEGTYLVVG
jgi:hypothetical protein